MKLKGIKNFTYVKNCKLCGSNKLKNVIQLSPIPIGDRYVSEINKGKFDQEYSLDIMMCGRCGHYQNNGYVNPDLIYGQYLSRPATTNPVLSDIFKEYVNDILVKYLKKDKIFAVEAGSNDGAFISYLQEKGSKVLGVEPSDLSKQANSHGIPTINNYFSLECSESIKNEHGKADAFIANHTFSNIIDLDDFVKGVKNLLVKDGVFCMQTHYHLDVIEKNLIENFTHEHLSGFYVKPLVPFFKSYNLELFDVKRVPAKEGSIRCFIQHKNGPRPIDPSVSEIIAYEESIGMDKENRHNSIVDFIADIKNKLHNLLDPEVKKGKKVAGFGTSIGATTFSFNYDLGKILSFFVDDDPYRHNLISPGYHIPVLPSKAIYDRKPEYVIILAPLYADIIMKKNQEYLNQGGTFIKIWPRFEVIS